jgi:hypothetical protein
VLPCPAAGVWPCGAHCSLTWWLHCPCGKGFCTGPAGAQHGPQVRGAAAAAAVQCSAVQQQCSAVQYQQLPSALCNQDSGSAIFMNVGYLLSLSVCIALFTTEAHDAVGLSSVAADSSCSQAAQQGLVLTGVMCMARCRAVELRWLLSGLGPSFVKIVSCSSPL